MEKVHLAAGDWVMIGLYLAICLLVSTIVRFCRNSTMKVDEHFLAGVSMPWIVIGCSIFATNIGSHVVIGSAGSAAAKGVAVVAYEWLGTLALVLFGCLFAPVYLGSGVRTVPQYMHRRFRSKRLRVFFATISILNSLSTKIAIDVYATGLFLKYVFNEQASVYLSSFILMSLTAVYTVVGGLTSVMYVGTMQCVVMVIGLLVVSVLGANKVGGFVEMWRLYPLVIGHAVGPYTTLSPNTTISPNTTFNPTTNNHSLFNTTTILPTTSTIFQTSTMKPKFMKPLLSNISTVIVNLTATIQPKTTTAMTTGVWNFTTPSRTTITTTPTPHNTTDCYSVDQHWNHIFRPLLDPDLPWLGVILSLPISGVWYWCTNQVFVQQILTSKHPRQARRASVFAGLLNFFPFLLIVLPGMTARVLFPDIIACPDAASCSAACGNALGCAHLAYYQLISSLGLSQGIVGLVFVMMLSAMMSSVANTFIAVSTVFTKDIWNILRPNAKYKEVVWVGRLVVILTLAIALAWIPLIENLNENVTFMHVQLVQSYIAPTICATVVMGMLSVRVTETGTLVSLILGTLLAIVRFAFDVKYPPPQCGETDDRPLFVRLNFLYCSLLMFIVSVVLVGVVSVCTQPQPLGMLGKLTWITMDKERYVNNEKEGGGSTIRGREMGMDNMTYRHSIGDDDVGAKVDVTEGEEEEEVEALPGESKVQLFEKWFSVGAVVAIFIALLIVFA